MNNIKLLALLIALLVMTGAEADNSWTFTSTPDQDVEALAADNSHWTYTAKSKRYANVNEYQAAELAANGSVLTMTRGLLFTAKARDRIRIDVNKRLALNGAGVAVTLPALQKGQTVRVTMASSSKGTGRALSLTNLSETSFSSSTTTGTDYEAKVTADGNVTLTATGGVYLFAISVSGNSGNRPQGSSTHDVARNPNRNQAVVTTGNNTLRYYDTDALDRIALQGGSLTVQGKDKVWTDTFAHPARLHFSKAGKGAATNGSWNNSTGRVAIAQAGGWLESAFVTFGKYADCTLYHVYVKGGQYASYTRVDSMLVRSYGDSLRADVVGLTPGSYSLRVVPVSQDGELTDKANEATGLAVTAYDRSGFAHLNHEGVGAYNDDGTLKAGARVLYVTAQNAKTVTCKVRQSGKDGDGTTFTGLQAIIAAYQKGVETRPLDVRLIGTIRHDDMDAFGSSAEGLQIKGKNNNTPMNITIEGIGRDATVYGFGLLLRNAADVELRNFAIMRCLDDAVSVDTDNKHVWIHHLDFFYGKPGSDADQAKGDGTTDIKGDSQYITVAYNHYFDSGKSSLCGMKSETGPNYIDYHHNWFDHSDSRHPRVRTMSVHVWNNYYDGCAKYGVGATTGSSVFVEANYFRHTKDPMLISRQGTDAKGDGTFSGETGGMIKSYGNVFAEKGSSANYTPLTQHDNATSFDCYEVDARQEQVPATVTTLAGGTPYDNFDTDPKLMYSYSPCPASDVPAVVTGWRGAGRMGHGDFSWPFTTDDDTNYAVSAALADAIDGYTTGMIGISK